MDKGKRSDPAITTDKPIDGANSGSDKPAIGKSQNDNGNAGKSIDPTALAGGAGNFGERYERDDSGAVKLNVDGTPRKRRGRKPATDAGNTGNNAANGNDAKPKPKPAPATKAPHDTLKAVETLSQTLLVLHMGVASITRFPDFALDKQESDLLATATANVMSEFEITPNPKMVAVSGLVAAAGQVYGPRAYLFSVHRQKLKATKKQGASKVAIRPDAKKPTEKQNVGEMILSNPSNFNLGG